jgi:hypothetical protein
MTLWGMSFVGNLEEKTDGKFVLDKLLDIFSPTS